MDIARLSILASFPGSPLPQRGELENEARTDKHSGEWNISLLHSILLQWHMMTADPPCFKNFVDLHTLTPATCSYALLTRYILVRC